MKVAQLRAEFRQHLVGGRRRPAHREHLALAEFLHLPQAQHELVVGMLVFQRSE